MLTILLSAISGILTGFFGWSGGRGDDYWRAYPNWPRWILQSWTRDWLIGPICALAAWILGCHDWQILLSIPLTGAALSTYWDWVFGHDNFFVHGLFVAMAALPITWATGHWMTFFIRILIVSAWMWAWSKAFKDANIEDSGRYAIVGLTIFMV